MPPPHALGDLLSAFEKYIHAGDDLPPLVRAGLLHVQFETIHPYLDGNGRIGRLLVTLLLEHWKLLTKPLLYLSLLFKRHRSDYYGRLGAARTIGGWEGRTDFFFDGVATIADEVVTSARELFTFGHRGSIARPRPRRHLGRSGASLRTAATASRRVGRLRKNRRAKSRGAPVDHPSARVLEANLGFEHQEDQMRSQANSPAEYVAELSPEHRAVVKKLRQVLRKNLPKGFTETIDYGMLAYVVPHRLFPQGYHCDPSRPLPFINLASQRHYVSLYHIGLYAGPLLDWLKAEWPKRTTAKLDLGKCCLRFRKLDDIPYDLIAELAARMTPTEWISAYQSAVGSRTRTQAKGAAGDHAARRRKKTRQ